jgi:hypothetical protein
MWADLDDEQRAILADYWWRRAEGEITSWVAFGHVLEDLRAENAPKPVLELAERSVADEYQHSVFCREWAVRFGHAEGEVRPRSERRLTFAGASERENRLLRIMLCCFTETVGCFLLRRVRPLITDPELRRLNQRHLADELRHSRVGWAELSTLDEAGRALLAERVPELLAVLPVACCEGPEEEHAELVPFGYFTPTVLAAAHAEAVREVIEPGLLHLGIRRAA